MTHENDPEPPLLYLATPLECSEDLRVLITDTLIPQCTGYGFSVFCPRVTIDPNLVGVLLRPGNRKVRHSWTKAAELFVSNNLEALPKARVVLAILTEQQDLGMMAEIGYAAGAHIPVIGYYPCAHQASAVPTLFTVQLVTLITASGGAVVSTKSKLAQALRTQMEAGVHKDFSLRTTNMV